MSYCVNCAAEFSKPSGICPNCHADQFVANEIIDSELTKNNNRSFNYKSLSFGYPGEKAALTISILISSFVLAIIGTLSFGLFLVILFINLLYLKINHLTFRRNMIRVSDTNFKKIDRLAKISAHRLGLILPEVFITEEQQYNAYTMGFYKYGFIVINSALVRDFKPSEILFVIGHEMGHMKRFHTTWLNLMNPAKAGGTRFLLAPVMQIIFNAWSVKAEYTADQAGLIACRDVDAAVNCLLKLAGGVNAEKEVDISQIINRKEYENELLGSVLEYLGTHPFVDNRIKQLTNFSNSTIYKGLRHDFSSYTK